MIEGVFPHILTPLLLYSGVFFAAFASAFYATPGVRRLALLTNLVDQPEGRRLHTVATPRGGGIAIFIAFHLSCLLMYTLTDTSILRGNITPAFWASLLVGSSLTLALGLVDDYRNIRWPLKLAGQFGIAAMMVWLGVSVERIAGIPLSPTIDFTVTVIWYLALMNAFNLIDGLDGLATGLAAVAALGLAGAAVLQRFPLDALVLFALFGACLGFLRYNFHPASIFLGDAGSLLLGFLLASIALPSSNKGTAFASLVVPLLAMGVPIFDTILAIWRRSVRKLLHVGNGIAQPDLEHLHHRLVRTGLTQHRVALLLYVLNLGLVTVGLLPLIFRSEAIGIYLLAFVIGSYIIFRHLARVELWDTGNAIIRGLRKPRRSVLSSILYPIVDALFLGFSLFLGLVLAEPLLPITDWKVLWLERAPFLCGSVFIVLLLSGTYSRVWSRARASDLVVLAATLLGGAILGLAFILLRSGEFSHVEVQRTLSFFCFSVGLICGTRVMPRFLEDFLELASHGEVGGVKPARVLLVGTDTLALAFIKHLASARRLDQPEVQYRRVVGLIGDDPNLRKRVVYGYRVLGLLDEIERVLAATTVDEVVIACKLTPGEREHILRVCVHLGVRLIDWSSHEELLTPVTTQVLESVRAAPLG